MRPIAFSVISPEHPPPTGAGTPVSLHATLARLISQALGAHHASLLATPIVGANGRIEWCTGLPGEVVGPSELDPASRAALRQRADALLTDLRRLQLRLSAEGPASRATARLLTQAVDLDLDACLHDVGGQPVLAPWGAEMRASAAPATAVVAPAVAPAPAAEAAARPAANTPPVAADSPAPSIPTPATSQAAASSSARRGGLHAAASLLLLLAGGGALAAALHARQPADAAIAARIDALTRGNADLGLTVDRARNAKCSRIP